MCADFRSLIRRHLRKQSIGALVGFPFPGITEQRFVPGNPVERAKLVRDELHVSPVNHVNAVQPVVDDPVAEVVARDVGLERRNAGIEKPLCLRAPGDAVVVPHAEQSPQVPVQDVARLVPVRVLLEPQPAIHSERDATFGQWSSEPAESSIGRAQVFGIPRVLIRAQQERDAEALRDTGDPRPGQVAARNAKVPLPPAGALHGEQLIRLFVERGAASSIPARNECVEGHQPVKGDRSWGRMLGAEADGSSEASRIIGLPEAQHVTARAGAGDQPATIRGAELRSVVGVPRSTISLLRPLDIFIRSGAGSERQCDASRQAALNDGSQETASAYDSLLSNPDASGGAITGCDPVSGHTGAPNRVVSKRASVTNAHAMPSHARSVSDQRPTHHSGGLTDTHCVGVLTRTPCHEASKVSRTSQKKNTNTDAASRIAQCFRTFISPSRI